MRTPINVLVAAFGFCTLTLSTTASAFEYRHVFVANRGLGAITELDADLTFVRHWFDGATLGSSRLSEPNGLAFTADGQLFIADSGNQRIVVIDRDGNFIREWSTQAAVGPGIESINFDPNGILYASANPGDGHVARFSQTGELLGQVLAGYDWLALGNVNFTPNGQLIVAPFNDRGLGFRVVDRVTGQAIEPAFFTSSRDLVEDMALDGSGVLYASINTANRVAVFNSDRTFRRDLQTPGLIVPTGIAINYRCEIIVGSYHNEANRPQLFVFSPAGQLLRSVTVPNLTLTESIAIVGQILPGSFEFPPLGNELTPSCDYFDAPFDRDGGARDSGTGDSGASPPTRSQPGCGCHLTQRSDRNCLWIGMSGLAILAVRPRRVR